MQHLVPKRRLLTKLSLDPSLCSTRQIRPFRLVEGELMKVIFEACRVIKLHYSRLTSRRLFYFHVCQLSADACQV